MMKRLLSTALLMFLLLGVSAWAQDTPPTATPQAKSDRQLEWEASVAPKYKTWPPLAYLEEDPKLPRALLIGDSISVGYTTRVREALKGKINLHRIPVNGGSTLVGLEKMDGWLKWQDKWDVIHFNFGLHDLSREVDGKADVAGPVKVPVEKYVENLEVLVGKLKATGAEIIWATTTPVPADSPGRVKGDELIYNAAAEKVMKKHGIRINDLYTFIQPNLEVAQPPKDVHFRDEGNDLFAPHIGAEIMAALEAKKRRKAAAAPAEGMKETSAK